jgi:hypothetical protein
MTVLAEDDLQITLPAGVVGRKFDDEVSHGLSHCMKAVDFIVELDDRTYFVEFKDPENPNATPKDSAAFLKKFMSGAIDSDLKTKYRDSWLYEHAVWGETAYRVWLPAKDAVVRARAADLAPLESVRPTVEQILHTAAAAKLLDALEDNLLLAPIQSSVVPLPHQLYALNRAMSRDRIRYLLADEVGLGKTIEAG